MADVKLPELIDLTASTPGSPQLSEPEDGAVDDNPTRKQRRRKRKKRAQAVTNGANTDTANANSGPSSPRVKGSPSGTTKRNGSGKQNLKPPSAPAKVNGSSGTSAASGKSSISYIMNMSSTKEAAPEGDGSQSFFVDVIGTTVQPPSPTSQPSQPPKPKPTPAPLPVVPEAGSSGSSSLLLPAHVSVSLDEPSYTEELPLELPPVDEDDEFIKYLDYEDVQKGAQRYFDNEEDESAKQNNRVCKHCGAEGDHKTADCPVTICLTCGAHDEHPTRSCPVSKVCFACGMKGHINRECPNGRRSMREYDDECDRCGSTLHMAKECPTIWRIYDYVTDFQRESMMSSRREKIDLELGEGGEGYIGEDEWCYNCGRDGHLGDDCTEAKKIFNVPKAPSAFGLYSTLSGPFVSDQSEQPKSSKRRKARDWEPGSDVGGPSNIGRKAKEKEKERLQKKAHEMREAEDFSQDWFASRSHPSQPSRRRSRSPDRTRTRNEKPKFQFKTQYQEDHRETSRPTLLDRIGNGYEPSRSSGRRDDYTDFPRNRHDDYQDHRESHHRQRSHQRYDDPSSNRQGQSHGSRSQRDDRHSSQRRHYYGGYGPGR